MKIVVIGNIATGKSEIIKYIFSMYPNFKVLSIDDVRREFGDRTEEGEERCKSIYLENIFSNSNNQIIELSGIGLLAKNTFLLVKNDPIVLVVYLRAEQHEITERLSKRVWDIPFPYDTSNIPKAIDYTKNEFSSGVIEKYLEICAHCSLISLQNTTPYDLHENIKILNSIIKVKLSNE